MLGSLSYQMIGLIGAISAPTVEQITADKVLTGPGRFCGDFFAVDLAANEKMIRKWGPDFYIYHLESSGGGFRLYEGFAPDTSGSTKSQVTVTGLPMVERLAGPEGRYGYLIHLPPNESGAKFYLHLFGDRWKGDNRDFPLLARLKLGSRNANRCPQEPE